mmetsp:Transcript_19951/g.37556  ORF Transcript_19951/g.37556 Transcript_19951/m.37556 type:complete len:81 (+) Transcript_19951:334-576(+)
MVLPPKIQGIKREYNNYRTVRKKSALRIIAGVFPAPALKYLKHGWSRNKSDSNPCGGSLHADAEEKRGAFILRWEQNQHL